MKTSIALIGFMGTGKTVVGKALAQRLSREFIELDSLVELKAGKTIPQIFLQEGEIAFRELEIKVTKEIALRSNTVIACGGGVVLNKINIDRLRQKCAVILLTASPDVILKRTSTDKNERPLLMASDKARKIGELIRFRQPLYERAAEIKVDTSKININTVTEQIISNLELDENFSF